MLMLTLRVESSGLLRAGLHSKACKMCLAQSLRIGSVGTCLVMSGSPQLCEMTWNAGFGPGGELGQMEGNVSRASRFPLQAQVEVREVFSLLTCESVGNGLFHTQILLHRSSGVGDLS